MDDEYQFLRIREALSKDNPLPALMRCVVELSGLGMTKHELIEYLKAEHCSLQAKDENWKQEAAVGDVLDMLHGFFVPNNGNDEAREFLQHFKSQE